MVEVALVVGVRGVVEEVDIAVEEEDADRGVVDVDVDVGMDGETVGVVIRGVDLVVDEVGHHVNGDGEAVDVDGVQENDPSLVVDPESGLFSPFPVTFGCGRLVLRLSNSFLAALVRGHFVSPHLPLMSSFSMLHTNTPAKLRAFMYLTLVMILSVSSYPTHWSS